MTGLAWRERAVREAKTAARSRERSVRTAERIVAAARELVAERNGEAFTTQELVERSGCSLQTIYRYFPSKAVLLLAVFEDVIATGTAEMAADVGTVADPVERLRRVIALSIPDASPQGSLEATLLVSLHTELVLVFPDEVEHAQRRYIDLVRSCIDEMVTTGRVPPRADIDQDAHLVTYLVRATYQALVMTRTTSRARTAAHVADFCLGALGLPVASAPPRRRRVAS